ncbi:hypothetical protein [Serratia silvae]|uniref:DUF2531 family protein n=1 Tax=Serratia silvae TaxID=2824122 RepID=A0ABT0KEE3_9GAMM|nr:hypothetical protein [Serratia silvae]MCL1030312.1 DUF2531 family protein [Serratia silvae]
MNKAWWCLLLFSPPLWAEQYRDPFQPPLTVACAAPAVSPAGWWLKGIIGTPELRYGWVVTPQGQWLGLLPRQRVLDGEWQVMQIRPRQLELVAQNGAEVCRPRTGSVVLTLGEKP